MRDDGRDMGDEEGAMRDEGCVMRVEEGCFIVDILVLSHDGYTCTLKVQWMLLQMMDIAKDRICEIDRGECVPWHGLLFFLCFITPEPRVERYTRL